MIILREDLFDDQSLEIDTEFDFSKEEVNDALVAGLNKAKVHANTYKIDEDEILMNLKVSTIVDYLDARTLEPLKLEIDFDDAVEFTINENQAEKLNIDLLAEELDLYQLVLELIIVNIPFNYSESERVTNEDDFHESGNQPFKKFLNKN